MKKQIRVERQEGYFGMVRSLEIIADGVSIGRIDQGKTLIFDVPDACQQVWGKMDWGETIRLDISDYDLGQIVVFRGYFTFNLLKGLGIGKMPFKVFLRKASVDESKAEQDESLKP